MKKLLITIIMLAMALCLYAKAETKLSYRSFIDYAEEGKVKSLRIAEFGNNNMAAVINKDGKDVEYLVDKPYSANDDILFIEFLKKNKVKYEITKKDYTSSSFMWTSILSGFSIFILPLLFGIAAMVITIIILGKVKRVERLLKKMQHNTINQNDSTNGES